MYVRKDIHPWKIALQLVDEGHTGQEEKNKVSMSSMAQIRKRESENKEEQALYFPSAKLEPWNTFFVQTVKN